MKPKTQSRLLSVLLGLALSTSVGFSIQVITVDTFDNATTSTTHMWNWYGGATFAWDSTQDHTGNGGGALYISKIATNSTDTIMVPETFAPGSGIWNGGAPVDLTLYTNVSLWFKWDTNVSTMPLSAFNSGPGFSGMGISLQTVNGWDQYRIFSLVPNTASNGWVQLNYQLINTIPQINQVLGLDYYDNKPTPWSGDVAFWIDDVVIEPGFRCICFPPPVIERVAKAIPGLNVFNSTWGNSFYDRQEVYSISNAGTSWYGVANAGNPVTYSFTIASMPAPASATAGCEAYLFLSPNPNAANNSPDLNEPNMVIALVQQDTNGNATLHLQYKVNGPNQQAMYNGGSQTLTDNATYTNYVYYTGAVGSQPGGPITVPIAPGINNITNETGNLGSVTNPATAAGTWTIRFTSNTNVMLVAPGGDTASFVITPYYASYLDPAAGGLRMYLGGQANNANALNQAVVYSHFTLSGTPTAMDDNFLTDATLNTNLWSNSQAIGPAGVLVVPASAAYWVAWTVPAGGFYLECGNQLTNLSVWTSPTMYSGINIIAEKQQLVDSSELPAGPTAFFNLIKRVYTQLQILLPGETAAPGTPAGKTGTPAPISLGAGGLVNVTVNACDATWHVINDIYDYVNLTTSDGAAITPLNTAMANGTVTFAPLQFKTAGPQTVTATDIIHGVAAGGTIPDATSSAVTVTP
ncbi:MAG: hypothetical protein WAO02_16700 [Verrucomicrobiia bacterium]